jgi:hypothetical protein
VDFSMFYVLPFLEWIFPCSTFFRFRSEFFHVPHSSIFRVKFSMFSSLPFLEWIFPCSADLDHGNKREKKCSSTTLRGSIARRQGGITYGLSTRL